MSDRIRFANQLRGVAAMSVAASHLIAVFWVVPDVVSAATFSPAQHGSPPGALALVTYPWFNFGPFGVALFFLISGFVIPFSLERHTRASFVGARLLRIYPTYIAALLLEVAVLYGASLAWQRPFTLDTRTIIANALLVYDVTGLPSIDLVNWTLSVELKFYLLTMLLMPGIRRGRAWVLVAASAVILGINAAMAAGMLDIHAPPSTVSYTISSHSVCLAFMLIGVAFNFHLRGLLSHQGLALMIVMLSSLFLLTWRLSVWSTQFPGVPYNYLAAIGLFFTLYALRHWIPRNPVLDGLAAISFPFYVVHSLLGYSMLRALMVGWGFGYYAALAVTMPALIVVSSGLHWMVERPTMRAGRTLTLKNRTNSVSTITIT